MPLYHLDDEPRPGTLARFAVSPFWPLLGVMLGGTWLGWPWFAVNAFAVGSPTRRRELALAVFGFVGAAALVFAILAADRQHLLSPISARFALLGLTLWKLAVSYRLYVTQARSFQLYEHYGGVVHQGTLVVLAAFFLDARLQKALGNVFLRLVLG